MIFRKTEKNEHDRTRELWEAVFREDTRAFLDYYYTSKTTDNDIYTAEDEQGQICSMLQLNPFVMQLQEVRFQSHYIIAVATRPESRKQGLMRELLYRSMRDMHQQGEYLTFLVPAAEAIYRPFDFRFVYNQRQGIINGSAAGGEGIRMREALPSDCCDLSAFAEECLDPYQIYTVRDSNYYEIMLKEQASQMGGIKMVYDGDRLIGTFCYTNEGRYEIREPFFLSDYEDVFLYAVYLLTGSLSTDVKCYGYYRQ